MAVRYRNSLNVPPILVEMEAYEDMLYIARSVKVEVAWFCEVTRLEDGTLVIGGVHLPEQQSSTTTVEIEPDDLFKFADAFIAEYGSDAYNTLRAWGHSHHTMGVGPSGQDQKMLDWMIDNNGSEFFLAIRINHAGDMQIDYATKHGLTFEDANYTLGASPTAQAFWAEQVKAKLRPITYAKTKVIYPATTQPYQGTKGTYQGTKTPTTPPKPKGAIAYDSDWDDLDSYRWNEAGLGSDVNSPAERSKMIDDITLDDLMGCFGDAMENEPHDALVIISDAIDEVLIDKGINNLTFPQDEMWGYAQRKYDEMLTFAAELSASIEGGTDDRDPIPPA